MPPLSVHTQIYKLFPTTVEIYLPRTVCQSVACILTLKSQFCSLPHLFEQFTWSLTPCVATQINDLMTQTLCCFIWANNLDFFENITALYKFQILVTIWDILCINLNHVLQYYF